MYECWGALSARVAVQLLSAAGAVPAATAPEPWLLCALPDCERWLATCATCACARATTRVRDT
eukprot:5784229-Lingulodinium_polyedra.AAC.1